MATYYTLLTKIGQASIANAVALGEMVNLTHMAVGDGNGNPTTPNENQTALVRERYRAGINHLFIDPDNPTYIVAEMIVPTTVGGWSVYEVGVFDDEGQLIAVANFPATYKPELPEGSGRDLVVRIVIQVSNSSVVTLKVDPAVVLASQAWVTANFVKKITVAGGLAGQHLAKKSNADEDFEWADPTAAIDVNVFSREESQTLAASQTIIDLATMTTDGAVVYVEGVRLREDQYSVTSSTRITLAVAYPAGSKATVVQNEETSRNAFALLAGATFTGPLYAPTPATGVRSQAVATMQKFADEFGALKSDIGYQKLPSGLIIQWGFIGVGAADVTTTFPIAFPNSCLNVSCTMDYTPGGGNIGYISGRQISNTQMASRCSSATLAARFVAIGH